MRIALVLFLVFVVTLPCSAQTKRDSTLLADAQALVAEKQYKKALKKYSALAALYKRRNQSTLRFNTLFEISEILLMADEDFEAKRMVKNILATTSQKDTIAAQAFYFLGKIESQSGKAKKALDLFQESLDIRQKKLPENHPSIAESLVAVGLMQNQLGQTAFATVNIQTALRIQQSVLGEEHHATAKTIGALGIIFSSEGNQDRAIELLQQSIDVFGENKIEEDPALVQLYFHLGSAHIERGDYELGLISTQRGLSILEKLKNPEHPDRAPFLNNIGKIYTQRNDFSQALNYYQQALKVVEVYHGTRYPDVADSYSNIAEVLSLQGKADSAVYFFEKSMDLNKSLFGEEHPRVAKNLSDIGSAFLEINELDEANAYFYNAYDLYERFYGANHITIAKIKEQIGKVLIEKGGYDSALDYFQTALNANVPFLFEVEDVSKNPPIDKVLDKNIFLSTLALKAQTLTKRYLIKNRFEDLESAYNNFLVCDSLIDDLRRSFVDYNDQLIFNRTASQVYEDAIYTCFLLKNFTDENKYIEEAFYFSEKNKSNILLQSFNDNEAIRFAEMPDSLEALEKVLKIKISVAEKNLLRASQERDSSEIIRTQQNLLEFKKEHKEFVNEIENNYPHYYQLKYDRTVASLEQVQDQLANDEFLVEYMWGEDRLFIFSITDDEAHLDLFKNPQSLITNLFDFRKSITDLDYITHRDSIEHAWNNFTSNANEIYKVLLENSIKYFSDVSYKNIIIVPEGILGYVPFEILLKTKPEFEGINYGKLDYLLHKYNISYAFSGSMLLNQIEKDVVGESISYGGFAPIYGSKKLSFSTTDPNFRYSEGTSYIDLPASRMGVQQIANMLEGTAFVNEDATEQMFRDTAAQFDILHLAMHGIYDDKNPLNSHLVFSQLADENDDNLLTAAELYNMSLYSSLVFIGACNSGFGNINRGEGIMSLSRSFAYAGCPSIVMSLWSVPDDETAKISNDFFKNLKNGRSKSEALRLAKLKYLSDAKVPPDRLHPLFWAGFVPIGEMSPIYTPNEFSNTWTLLAAIAVLVLTIFVGRRIWKRLAPSP